MNFGDYGLFSLRLAIAAIFFVHGYGKHVFWKMKPSAEMSAGKINFMKFISIAEALGAAAMLFGFLTQFAAIGLGIIMLGAIYSKIKLWKIPFSTQENTGWEFDLIILSGCVALATLGSGQFALERIWNLY